jgi:hypothetical protein
LKQTDLLLVKRDLKSPFMYFLSDHPYSFILEYTTTKAI